MGETPDAVVPAPPDPQARERAVPVHAAHDHEAPDHAAPGHAAPDHPAPDHPAPGRAAPEDAAPEQPDEDAVGAERHVSVLLERCVDLLAPALARPGAVVVDATLGLGGHAEALLRRCPEVVLVGLDRDPQALALAGERLAPFGDRVHLVRTVFDGLPDALADLGLREVHGVLFDLGVSSLQLDEVDRGFSYARDAPLDMRMDPTSGATAAEVLATYPPRDLVRVLREYGEERFASRIVERVVAARDGEPLRTTRQLAELVRDAVPAATRRTGGNPAKRTFQALRVEVNDELGALRRALPAAVDALAVGGRVAVMSFQSLEDRITKQVLAAGAASTTPHDLPVELPEHAPLLRLLTRGAETAPEPETTRNPRAASVRLRAAERLRRGTLRRSAA